MSVTISDDDAQRQAIAALSPLERRVYLQTVLTDELNDRQLERSARRGLIDDNHDDAVNADYIWLDSPDTALTPVTPAAELGDFKIPGVGTVVFYGLYGSGKSMFVTDLCCHIATGTPWLGSGSVQRRKVVYLQLEGTHAQITERIVAWETEHGVEVGVDLVQATPEVFDWRGKHAALQLSTLMITAQADLLVIDTLDAGRRGGSNMLDDEVGRIFADVLPKVSDHTRQVFVIGHSNAKDESLAGLSRQGNAVEAIVHIKKRGAHRVAVLEKTKYAPGQPVISFEIVNSAYVSGMGPVGVVRPVEAELSGPAAWLVDELAKTGGSAMSAAIKEAAVAAEISDRQLRDARERLVEVEKLANGSTVWTLRNGAS